jgi:hypothetical protein
MATSNTVSPLGENFNKAMAKIQSGGLAGSRNAAKALRESLKPREALSYSLKVPYDRSVDPETDPDSAYGLDFFNQIDQKLLPQTIGLWMRLRPNFNRLQISYVGRFDSYEDLKARMAEKESELGDIAKIAGVSQLERWPLPNPARPDIFYWDMSGVGHAKVADIVAGHMLSGANSTAMAFELRPDGLYVFRSKGEVVGTELCDIVVTTWFLRRDNKGR